MANAPERDVTELLLAWKSGDEAALACLVPLVESELRRIARRHLAGERRRDTLQTTALVNEAYLRLIDQSRVRWQSRGHFFAIAAQAMRRILVSAARARCAEKRGGGVRVVSLEEAAEVGIDRAAKLVALDEALQVFAVLDPRRARVVDLRYFGGFSVEETAEALEISVETVMRDWQRARAWLSAELTSAER
jgi:RNA polymerase sigma-70 factor (ECF subfamily)